MTSMSAPRNDLGIYGRHAEDWWQDGDSRAFRSLRAVKQHHLSVLRRELGSQGIDRRIADLGCGGGLLSIPLASGGARVVGVDRCSASLEQARQEARRRHVSAEFLWGDLRDTGLPGGIHDVVLLSDVVEHLEDPRPALAEAARLLRPGGTLYVNTLSRTLRGALLGVHVAEGLGFVPHGTHDPKLFLRPAELAELASAHGLRLQRLCGESVDLWRTLRTGAIHMRASRSSAVSYGAFFVRDEVASR